MPEPDRILIVGASTRAAAFSAARAGLRPLGFDQFADADVDLVGSVLAWKPEDGLEAVIEAAGDACDWLYTGPIENHPELVGEISKHVRLLGNGPGVLSRVRNPWILRNVLNDAGFPTLEILGPTDRCDLDGSWLRKDWRSSGGTAVAGHRGQTWNPAATSYLQRRAAGGTYSALFLGGSKRAVLLGVARQGIGALDGEFLYRSGLGPWPVPEPLHDELRRLGRTLAEAFELTGLFGVDFHVEKGRPMVLEVNPRYTASVELFEFALGRSLVREHIQACLTGELGEESVPRKRREPMFWMKSILYATARFTFPRVPLPPWASAEPFAMPGIADVPRPGTEIPAGAPIMTLYGQGATRGKCRRSIAEAEAWWRSRLE